MDDMGLPYVAEQSRITLLNALLIRRRATGTRDILERGDGSNTGIRIDTSVLASSAVIYTYASLMSSCGTNIPACEKQKL